MLIGGVDLRVHNIHNDSTSDGLPPTYEVYAGGTYIGHCFEAGRGRWTWGTPDQQRGTARTRRECLAVLVARHQGAGGPAPSDS